MNLAYAISTPCWFKVRNATKKQVLKARQTLNEEVATQGRHGTTLAMAETLLGTDRRQKTIPQ